MKPGDPLVQLLRELKARNYRFEAVTPATHAIVLSRPLEGRPCLRDIFGWSRPFRPDELEPELLQILRSADAVTQQGATLRSRWRVASLGEDLFLHSRFPTVEPDAVFFGPDTYRFVRFVREKLRSIANRKRIVDMGAGSGAGGLAAARLSPGSQIVLVDRNARALELAKINAAAAGLYVDTAASDVLPEGADVVIANPPFLMDQQRRTYRDGGSTFGADVSLDWVSQALTKMAPGGTMLLYTGAAFTAGEAPLLQRLDRMCSAAGAVLQCEEIDPDIFGEELKEPSYAGVERIAAVGIVVRMPE